MVTILLRQNINQMAVGDMFNISQPTVSRIWRRIMPLIEQVVCLHAPPFPDVWDGRTVLVDGTDVPTGNRTGTSCNYSGKRHRQGLLLQVSCTLTGMLLAVSDPVPGAHHDRRAITEVGWETILDEHNWIADPGYQRTTAITPTKKPHGRELSRPESK